MQKRYHKDVYAPPELFYSPGVVRLRYSLHALRAAEGDRLGNLSYYLPTVLDFDTAEIVEVELDASAGHISKRVARLKVLDDLAIVLVVADNGTVCTVWGNREADRHESLRKRKYVKPPCAA